MLSALRVKQIWNRNVRHAIKWLEIVHEHRTEISSDDILKYISYNAKAYRIIRQKISLISLGKKCQALIVFLFFLLGNISLICFILNS